jgi:hypothetical protein
MEVNLAVFIMAVAVLGMVALYPLGFRESQQSRDDVVEAVLAEGILNPIVATLSATNLTWSAWEGFLGSGALYPNNGWLAYCGNEQSLTPKGRAEINGVTGGVLGRLPSGNFSTAGDARSILSKCDSLGIACALVASYGETPTYGNGSGANGFSITDRTRIVLTLRLARRAGQLFGQPAFYTEVHFQGNPNNPGTGGGS